MDKLSQPEGLDTGDVVPLALGNAGVVTDADAVDVDVDVDVENANSTKPRFSLGTMNVAFNSTAPGVYVCAVTWKGQLSLSFNGTTLKRGTLQEYATIVREVLETVVLGHSIATL